MPLQDRVKERERPFKDSMIDALGITEERWYQILKKYQPILDSMMEKRGKSNSELILIVKNDRSLKAVEKLTVVYWAARNQGAEIAKLQMIGRMLGRELVKESKPEKKGT